MISILALSSVLWPIIVGVLLVLAGMFIYRLGFNNGKIDAADQQKKSKKQSRSTLGGVFSEQVAPFLPNFPPDLKASEARFVGKPIDFLIFKGMDEQDISEVVFVEIKSGTSQLSTNERKVREAILNKRVRWYEYKVSADVAKINEDASATET